MKRIIIALLAAVSLTVAFAPVSPYSLSKTMDNQQRLEQSKGSYAAANWDLNASKSALTLSQNKFIEGRSFEVHFGDITRLKQLFDGIAGISVGSVTGCSVKDSFSTTVEWSEDSQDTAVRISLTVEDILTALTIIDKMELPLYQIVATEPNMIEIVFLTGEEIK